MAKKVVIFGIGFNSKMVLYDAEGRSDFEIAAFSVDKEYMEGNEFLGLPLVEFERITELYPPEEYDMLVISAGYKRLRNKEFLYDRVKSKGYKLRNYISRTVDFSKEVVMGDNNIIFAQAHIGIGGVMGNNNIIAQQVFLGHNFIMGDNNFIASQVVIGGHCTIKNTCHLGFNCTILEGVTIEEETLVGAGSVVIKNSEPFSTIVGNPSRIIRYHKDEGIELSNIGYIAKRE
ncbi:MAG: acetyltransferase [Clostridiaceae bacterium]